MATLCLVPATCRTCTAKKRTLQFELLVIQYPDELKGILALFDVTPKYLRDSFVVHFSPNGSNRRTKEEAVVYFWFEYISECADGGIVSVQEILKFFSGSSKMPATGFDGTLFVIRTVYQVRLLAICQ